MIKIIASIIRIVVLTVISVTVGYLMTIRCELSPKTHAWLLGGIAGVFAIADYYFEHMQWGLNEILRRDSYSVRKIEELKQIIPGLRDKAQRLWNCSVVLKVIVIAIAALEWEDVPATWSGTIIFFGYGILTVIAGLSIWSKRAYSQIEDICDEIVLKEAKHKESKALQSGLLEGESHNFDNDSALKRYSKTAPRPSH